MLLEKLDIKEDFLRLLKEEGITNLYPPQELAVKAGILEGKNIILCTPTASGKTLASELAIIKKLEQKEKTVYIVPLKALAYEKYRDFQKYEKLGFKVILETGDMDAGKYSRKPEFDIMVATAEKCDSIMRSKPEWFTDVRLLVLDEIHLIASDRGPVYEIITSKMLKLLPGIQVIGLSATIGNADEIAAWVDAKLVDSDWRPVKLREWAVVGKGIDSIKKIVKENLSKKSQVLVFVNSRRSAESVAEQLAETNLNQMQSEQLKQISEKITNALSSPTKQCLRLAICVEGGAAFHHAGLVNSQRVIIEDSFREGLIKAIVATPTLAAGVNLPARTVVIRDLHRFEDDGMQNIPVLEYKQMCLPYSSRVLMEDGRLIPIGKIVEENISGKVISFNLKGGKAEPKEITAVHERKAQELIKLTTAEGFSLELTPEHPILAGRGWTKARELESGDEICYLRDFGYRSERNLFFYKTLPSAETYVKNKTDLFELIKAKYTRVELAKKLGKKLKTVKEYTRGKKAVPLEVILKIASMLNLKDVEIAERISQVKTAYGNTLDIPLEISQDFMWFVGIIASDGNINETKDKRTGSVYHKVRLSNTNKKIIEKSINVLSSLGLNPNVYPRGKSTELEIGCSLLAKILDYFGVPSKQKSHRISVAPVLMGYPPYLINSFVMGVFDGDGNYCETKTKSRSTVRRVLFTTASKKFAYDLHNLLIRLGIYATIKQDKPHGEVEIRGKKVRFRRTFYNVSFRRIGDINKFTRYCTPLKYPIPRRKYSGYHNINRHHDRKACYEWLKVDNIKTKRGNFNVYNLSVEDNENYIAENFIIHNCGRAGRPKYDKEGDSIAFAKNESDLEFVQEHYVNGTVEDIHSLLGVQPVLRMHILSSIASEFTKTNESLVEFFKSTFFGFQYGVEAEFQRQIEKIIDELCEWKFIEKKDKFLLATPLGRRVSELYIDPLTAKTYVDYFTKAEKENKTRPLAIVEVLCDAAEMRPHLRVKKEHESSVWNQAYELENDLLRDLTGFDLDFEFLGRFKTARMFEDWITEKTEQEILDDFDIPPGILNQKIQNLEWLAYSASEITRLTGLKRLHQALEKIDLRVQHGIKEELIPLIGIKGVGRVRARKLFKFGIKNPADLKKADLEKLKKLLGEKTAEKILEQLI